MPFHLSTLGLGMFLKVPCFLSASGQVKAAHLKWWLVGRSDFFGGLFPLGYMTHLEIFRSTQLRVSLIKFTEFSFSRLKYTKSGGGHETTFLA